MRIKPFNEIMDSLKGAGSTNDTEDVEKLAQQLHAQGIATSIMEAREKAKSMLHTEQHVTDFSEKKQALTTYNDPRNNPKYNKYRAAMVEEMRRRAITGRPSIQIQDEFQTPGYEQRNGNAGLPRAVVTEKPKERPAIQNQPRQEIKQQAEQEKPKKENSSVDLNDVFNFGKR